MHLTWGAAPVLSHSIGGSLEMSMDCIFMISNSSVMAVIVQALSRCLWLLVSTQETTNTHCFSHCGEFWRALNLNLETKMMTIHEAGEGSRGRSCRVPEDHISGWRLYREWKSLVIIHILLQSKLKWNGFMSNTKKLLINILLVSFHVLGFLRGELSSGDVKIFVWNAVRYCALPQSQARSKFKLEYITFSMWLSITKYSHIIYFVYL